MAKKDRGRSSFIFSGKKSGVQLNVWSVVWSRWGSG